jgi:hypothetical protein
MSRGDKKHRKEVNRERRKRDKEKSRHRWQQEVEARNAFLFMELPELTPEELWSRAAMHYEVRNDDIVSESVPKADMDRLMVNYLRHEVLGYEAALRRSSGRVVKPDSDRNAKEMALSQIAAKYSWLAEECERQRKE